MRFGAIVWCCWADDRPQWLLRYPKSDVGLEKELNSVAHEVVEFGVVHSGIYYAEGSLRAQLCVSGCQLRALCSERGLWIDHCGNCGATLGISLTMQVLLDRGRANGRDPSTVGKEAWSSNRTLILSSIRHFCSNHLCGQSGEVVDGSKKMSSRPESDPYNAFAGSIDSKCGVVQTSVGRFESATVVNVAGLFDQVAKRAVWNTIQPPAV